MITQASSLQPALCPPPCRLGAANTNPSMSGSHFPEEYILLFSHCTDKHSLYKYTTQASVDSSSIPAQNASIKNCNTASLYMYRLALRFTTSQSRLYIAYGNPCKLVELFNGVCTESKFPTGTQTFSQACRCTSHTKLTHS